MSCRTFQSQNASDRACRDVLDIQIGYDILPLPRLFSYKAKGNMTLEIGLRSHFYYPGLLSPPACGSSPETICDQNHLAGLVAVATLHIARLFFCTSLSFVSGTLPA